MGRPIHVAHVATVDSTHRFLLLGQLRHLREAGYEVTAISASGPHVQEIQDAGIRHLAWPHISRSWSLKADFLAMRSLVRILKRERFDVVHTHNPKPGIMGRLASRIAGVPCVVNTVHGLYAMPEDSWHKRTIVLGLERVAGRFSDYELYQSNEDLEWARRAGVVEEARSGLLGNGTDVSFFDDAAVTRERRDALRRELGIPQNALVVGAVGRLVVEKGFLEFFTAARRLRASRPDVRFLVLGSPDPSKPDAISGDEISRASNDVVFAGWRKDVRDLMALMDVFVLASYREGLPRSAVEAAAMARAMVLTDIRGCREVVRDGHEGLLVPPRDADSLTTAIATLLADAELRERFGKAARTRALERFDENAVFVKIAGIYEQLLGAGKNDVGAQTARKTVRHA